MSTQALTREQKLQALAHRFYQGSAWQPKVGDYYTTSRADLELYRVMNVEGGKLYTEYCTRPGELTEWDADTFTTHGFGPRRVHVPDFILASAIAQTAPQHSDDVAVDRFAAAMKAKLAAARAKGRAGWDDPVACSAEFLAQLLVEHLGKGNTGTFEDVANFAMMLHQRGADPNVLTEAAAPQPERSGPVEALPYQTLFNAIAAAIKSIPGTSHISISVEAFRSALSTQGTKP